MSSISCPEDLTFRALFRRQRHGSTSLFRRGWRRARRSAPLQLRCPRGLRHAFAAPVAGAGPDGTGGGGGTDD